MAKQVRMDVLVPHWVCRTNLPIEWSPTRLRSERSTIGIARIRRGEPYTSQPSVRHPGERSHSADEDMNDEVAHQPRNSLCRFSPTEPIRIKLAARTAEISQNLARLCWTSKNTAIESRPFQVGQGFQPAFELAGWKACPTFSSRGTAQHNG